MGYNGQRYLEDRERLLEPDSVIIKGNHKWHQPVIVQHATVQLPPPDFRTEQELLDVENDHLRKHGAL